LTTSCPIRCPHGISDVAVRTYAENLKRVGHDGLGFNEHHCSSYGLMNSPNLMAACAAQRIKRVKLLIYGNLLAAPAWRATCVRGLPHHDGRLGKAGRGLPWARRKK